jgi:light-independent protochlorophyllide reductase subunit B
VRRDLGPFHVQDAPARYAPQMGGEGANVIFDTWVHPLMMGSRSICSTMFREDFEFADGRRSHHGRCRHRPPWRGPAVAVRPAPAARCAARVPRRSPAAAHPSRRAVVAARPCAPVGADAEGAGQDPVLRARQGAAATPSASPPSAAWRECTLETLYDAKAHFGR